MKLLKITALCCVALIAFNFTSNSKSFMIKPPKLIKGTVEDIQVLKKETQLNVQFDYSGMEVAKTSEKEWVSKQKMKGVEDPIKATEEFNTFWYKEVIPYQEEKFIEWHNKNCEGNYKIAKGVQNKYTMTLKPTLLIPSGGFSTLAALTSHVIISETANGKVIAILEIPNINSGVPALKERIAIAYGAAGKACAMFFLENLK